MKNKKIVYISVITLVFIFSFNLIVFNNTTNENATQTTTKSILSDKKIGWGIKRKLNNEQPDLGKSNKELLEKYEGIAMGNNNDRCVYLTFDEGYEAGYTSKILDILNENDVKAAFFITGHYLNSEPELVERMINEGHIVGNHTVNHKSMPDLNNEEIKKEVMKLHTSVYEKYDYEMRYLRPPMGEFSERTLDVIKELGYKTTMWSLAYDDWDENKQGREEYGKDKIISNIHNGAIILLHANSADNSNILDECIKKIKNMGYEFKSLDEFKN